MTNDELSAIRERAVAATPGPWEMQPIGRSSFGYELRQRDSLSVLLYTEGCYVPKQEEANALFIAHAREDVPALLAEVDRLRAENTLLREHGVIIDS